MALDRTCLLGSPGHLLAPGGFPHPWGACAQCTEGMMVQQAEP